jgi:hypothetical protein
VAGRHLVGAVTSADRTAPPAGVRRLLTAWLGLATSSLVVAGLFAALVAFARTPAVQLLGSAARLFHLALIAHVTFALTIWFVAFAGLLWVTAAWRYGYPLHATVAWAGWALAAAGATLAAVPAFTASGTPYLNDYVPVIHHRLFWTGLLATLSGVGVLAAGYLEAWARGRRRADPLPATALALAALALLLALATLALTWMRLDPHRPWALQLRALFWGSGHLFQFVHTAGMLAAWGLAATFLGRGPAVPAAARGALWACVPFLVGGAGAYLIWPPETLLTNRVITWTTFIGLGGPTLPLAVLAATSWARTPRPRPWGDPLFSGPLLSLVLFAVGGLMGFLGVRQDTRIPAHYHGMVGAVTLAYMALTPRVLALTGRTPWRPWLTRWQPYLYGLGLLGLMVGLHWAGGRGAPRKTLGFSWADAEALAAMNLMGLGSVLALAGGLAFVANIGVPLLRAPGPATAARPVPAVAPST